MPTLLLCTSIITKVALNCTMKKETKILFEKKTVEEVISAIMEYANSLSGDEKIVAIDSKLARDHNGSFRAVGTLTTFEGSLDC